MRNEMVEKDNLKDVMKTSIDKILLVDDETVNIYILAKYLKKNNFSYDTASSGEEALEAIKKEEYSAVLMDVIMPGMDGFEACKAIHRIKPEVPVIILTALVDDDSIRYSFQAGAIDYIKKPINETELIMRIENVVKMRRAKKKLKNIFENVMNDLQLASEIQAYILPEWIFCRKLLFASAMYIPSNKVGGDLYDVITLDENRHVVYMGDISGHGIQAALLMTAVKSIIQEIVMAEKDSFQPHAVIMKLNKIFTKTLFKQNYITLLLMLVDFEKGKLRAYNAGHPPLIVIDKGNVKKVAGEKREIRILATQGGCPLGWLASFEYKQEDEVVADFSADTQFLLYTDGVYECLNKQGEILGLTSFFQIIKSDIPEIHAQLLPQQIFDVIKGKGYNISFDDFSILSINAVNEKKEKYEKLFIMKSDLALVGDIGRQAEESILAWCTDKEFAMQVELVVNEVLNNIIIHSQGKKEARKPIAVALKLLPKKQNKNEKICLRFMYKSEEWNMSQVVKQKLLEEEDFLSDSGRGIRIVLKLSSEFYKNRLGEVEEVVVSMENNYDPLEGDMGDEEYETPVLMATENV